MFQKFFQNNGISFSFIKKYFLESSTTLKKDPTLLADFNYFCLGEGGGGEYKRNNNFFQILSDLDSFLNEVSFSPHKFVSHFKPYQEGGKNGIRGAAAHCLWSSSITDL